MKKLFLLLMCLVLISSVIACGASKEERIAELEAELSELKSGDDGVNEQKIWPDDTIIAFTDSELLAYVREITGVTERDITYGDVKDITSFDWVIHCKNLGTFKYFTSLVNLDVSVEDNTDLSGLKNLVNLTELEIEGKNIEDISELRNLKKLTFLNLNCPKVKDIEVLGDLKNLTTLNLKSDKVEDYSVLTKVEKLINLDINNSNLTNIDFLENLENVKTLSLYAPKLNDFEPINNMPNCGALSLVGDMQLSNIDRLDNVTELSIWHNKLLLDLDEIGVIPNLKALTINNAENLVSLGNIERFEKLEKLELYELGIEEEEMELIEQSISEKSGI